MNTCVFGGGLVVTGLLASVLCGISIVPLALCVIGIICMGAASCKLKAEENSELKRYPVYRY